MEFSVSNEVTLWNVLMKVMICLLLLFLSVLIEALIQFICSRIQNKFFSSIFYWTIYAASRFVLFAIGFVVSNHAGKDLLPLYLSLTIVYIMPIIFWSLIPCMIKVAVWVENRRLDRLGNGLLWIYPGPLLLRHHHLPAIDLIRCIYALYRRKRDNRWPFRCTAVPVTMLDSYPNDPVWPETSMVHSIMIFVCDECTKDNGFYLIRSSLLRKQCFVRHLGPYAGVVDGTWLSAIYQDGVILILERNKIYTYDIRNDHFSLQFFATNPTFVFELCWILLDDGEELGDRRNPTSTYFRLILKSGDVGLPFAYQQFLIEISENKRTRESHFVQRVSYPWPWLFQGHQLFITSTGQIGMQAKLRDGTSPGEVTWKTCVVYDPKSLELISMPDMEDLMETDRPLRLYAQRFLEYNDTDDLPCASVLNEHEALVCRDDGTIWRTRFRPASLKAICMEKIFKAYGKKLHKFSAKDWLQMTGVDMWSYFPSQKWKEF